MRIKSHLTLLSVFVFLAIFLFCPLNGTAKIVFQGKMKHAGDTSYHIYAMEDDGSNLRRITPWHRYDRTPRWFPDGKRIVFERDWGENKLNTGETMRREFFIIDETGRNEHSFMENPHRTGTSPVPSPDGRHIAFDSLRTGELDIYVYDLARDKLTALTNNKVEGGYTQAPSWSPDGSRIVYRNGEAIWIMDADGGRKEQIVPAPATLIFRAYVYWSPSGRYIIYYETELEPVARRLIVHKVSTGARDVHKLPTPEGKYGRVGGLTWMGDDNTVLLSYQETGNIYNIYRYDLNSRRMTKLTDFPQGHALYPHWVEGPLAVSPAEKVTTRWGYLKQQLAQ
ncbi:MAG: DPP IV N-terminal domain-containing protein [Candidatus Poribacteria bacterium]|nr:DPP IV N-terminal domain-containing protein [Candidatus Poribacteria bacterium]